MAIKKPIDQQLRMDLMDEAELSGLQRLYRLIERDKLTYSGETSSKLKRQRKQIMIMKKEQNNILTDFKIATCKNKKIQEEKVNKYLDELLEDYKCLGILVTNQNIHLSEIDRQIKKMRKAVVKIKLKTITDQQSQARILAGQRSVVMLENKLEVQVKKFNAIIAENSKLRAEIDHLLQERAHFNLLWEKVLNCLNAGKKCMIDLIEQATLAYDQREEWNNKLVGLRFKANQDWSFRTKEARTLYRKMDYDCKLQEFLGMKGQRRILADLEQREVRKKQNAEESMKIQLEQYTETLEQIQEFCGESNIERLAVKFVKQEEENFALFNYINELNHESESLSYAIDSLKKNIDSQRELNNKREEQQKTNIENLEKRLETQKFEQEAAEHKLKTFDSDLTKVFDGINVVFNMLKCSAAPILELLGDQSKINQFNVMMYLGLIEKRTTILMQLVYNKERTLAEKAEKAKRPIKPGLIVPDSKNRYLQNSIDKLVPTQPCPLCVQQELVSDVIDTLQIVHTPRQVEEKLNARLELPHGFDRLHNVSACHLPQSRRVIQMRYQ